MNKKKLLFVFEHHNEKYWLDGLWGALELLKEEFDIYNLNLANEYRTEIPSPDFVLGWGAFRSKVDTYLQNEIKGKKGLCIAGYAHGPVGMENYDVLFYETKWGRDYLSLGTHPNIFHAFGVNTDIYFPSPYPVPIVYDYIGVGSFASWKRWEKMKDKKGIRLVVGEVQQNNMPESMGIIEDLLKGQVIVSNTLSPIDLSNLLTISRTLYMPSDVLGGGERAILEARACSCKVEIELDNPKLLELVEGPIYDHKYYAKQLAKGILSCL